MLSKIVRSISASTVVAILLSFSVAHASGGGSRGGGGTPPPPQPSSVDKIQIKKAVIAHSQSLSFYEILVCGLSSDPSARLYAYNGDTGALFGAVQCGGQYGGSVFVSEPYVHSITVRSSSGGSATVATTPFSGP